MNAEELDRLASLIADALLSARTSESGRNPTSARPWVPAPIRPEPPARGGEPPAWSGAAQSLADIAPGKRAAGDKRVAPHSRVPTAELTRATRAAAAGRGGSPEIAPSGDARPAGRRRSRDAASIDVGIGVSNRHLHVSAAHFQQLFGATEPTLSRELSQPGQFAAKERVAVIGPAGRLDDLRIVGPARQETQLELSLADCRAIGIEAPVQSSGALESSAGGVTLQGPSGSVSLQRGVIVAARHLHLSVEDARRWGLRDGDILDVRCGAGKRAATLHDVLVRSGKGHATEIHLDTDEAHACGVKTGDRATILAWRTPASRRRPLLTEREVQSLARRKQPLPEDALLTPSARDRARALGLLEG